VIITATVRASGIPCGASPAESDATPRERCVHEQISTLRKHRQSGCGLTDTPKMNDRRRRMRRPLRSPITFPQSRRRADSSWFQRINATPRPKSSWILGGGAEWIRSRTGERRRIAELVAAGAPPWKLDQETNRSRYAIRRAVVALYRPAKRQPLRPALRLSVAEREEISRGLAAGESLRAIARSLGRAPVDRVPRGHGEWRARPVQGVCG
jgi:hypothetical protein